MSALAPVAQTSDRPLRLSEMTTETVSVLLGAGKPVAVLLPVGSVEPHGPHLPLGTDTVISETAAERAIAILAARGISAVLAPSIPYGVTDFALGFAGAISVPAAALSAFLRAVAQAHLAAGFAHVCLVNNHLEPAQDAAVRGATVGFPEGAVSVACPLTRRWGRTLSAEFKSGACHAGRYETSIVLAHAPALVDEAARAGLPEVPISLSTALAQGVGTFAAMGLDQAYAGAPAEATAAEGDALLDRLAEMIVTEVVEALAAPAGA